MIYGNITHSMIVGQLKQHTEEHREKVHVHLQLMVVPMLEQVKDTQVKKLVFMNIILHK